MNKEEWLRRSDKFQMDLPRREHRLSSETIVRELDTKLNR